MQIANDLKAARKKKGLSQRELSQLVSVPQSHISKIENNGVDIRISSLIEIARALDLEVTLLPRQYLSTVQAITDSHNNYIYEDSAVNAKRASQELQRLKQKAKELLQQFPLVSEAAQLQSRINDLARMHITESWLHEIKELNKSLESINDDTEISETLSEIILVVKDFRNRLAHNQTELSKHQVNKPLYSLDDDDGI